MANKNDSLEEVRQFLDAEIYKPEPQLNIDLHEGRHPFVTISRQTGAGGHTLAKTLLKRMDQEKNPLFDDWQMFDHELCMKILQDPKLKVSLRALLNEEYHSQIADMIYELIEGYSPQSKVVATIFQALRTLATFGKVILVGRAGSCVTRALPGGVHVRLVDAKPNRIRRMEEIFHLTEEQAKKQVQEQDVARARLVKDYFNRDIEDPLLYDVVWNTDTVPMEMIAEGILQMVKARAKMPAACCSHG